MDKIKNIRLFLPATGMLVAVLILLSGAYHKQPGDVDFSGEWVHTGFISGFSNPAGAQGDTLRIHFISGSKQYQSEPSLKKFQQMLESNFQRVKVTASWGVDAGNDLPDIHHLADADLMLVFTRRMVLPEEQLAYIMNHVKEEKPVIGIRTASHAFQDYLDFDNQVLGGNYSNHGREEPMTLSVAEGAEGHSLLTNVRLWDRLDIIYYNPDIGPDTKTLLFGRGQTSNVNEPMAWTNRYGTNGKAFYTSLGYPSDFENENFLNLLFNAIEWTTQRKLQRVQNRN